jgi:MFS family permease
MNLADYLRVVGGILNAAVCGSLNCWGMILPYVASYYRSFDPTVSVSTISAVYAGLTIVEGFGWLIYMQVIRLVGVRSTNLLGMTLMSLAYILGSFIKDPYLFIALFSVCFGFGISFCSLSSMNVIVATFPNNKGLISGILSIGFGASPMLYSLIALYCCNPDNLPPTIVEDGSPIKYFDHAVSDRLPFTMLMLGIFSLVLGLISVATLPASKKKAAVVHDEEEVKSLLKDIQNDEETKFNPTYRELMATPRLWKLFVMLFTGFSYSLWVIVSFKTFAAYYIKDDAFLSYVGVLGALSNGVSRFVFPFLMDYYSFKSLNNIAQSLQIVLSFTFYYSVSSRPLFLLVVMLSFFTNGSQFYPLVLSCNQIYGKFGPKAFTLIAWGCTLASAAPSAYFYFLVDNFGFESSYMFVGCLCLICLLVNNSLTYEPEWPEVSEFKSYKT